MDRPRRLEQKFILFDYVPCFWQKTDHQSFETSKNTTWREGRWTGSGNHCYLCNRRTKCVLTVSFRRPGKLVGHVCQRWGPVSFKTVSPWSTPKIHFYSITYHVFGKIQTINPSKHRKTQHGGREGEKRFRCTENLVKIEKTTFLVVFH